MEQVHWWRSWVSSGLLTLFVAFGCCLVIIRENRQELGRAVDRIKGEYERLHVRLDDLSRRMDLLEEQILKILLDLHPEA